MGRQCYNRLAKEAIQIKAKKEKFIERHGAIIWFLGGIALGMLGAATKNRVFFAGAVLLIALGTTLWLISRSKKKNAK